MNLSKPINLWMISLYCQPDALADYPLEPTEIFTSQRGPIPIPEVGDHFTRWVGPDRENMRLYRVMAKDVAIGEVDGRAFSDIRLMLTPCN